jgi:hypothetical protein
MTYTPIYINPMVDPMVEVDHGVDIAMYSKYSIFIAIEREKEREDPMVDLDHGVMGSTMGSWG